MRSLLAATCLVLSLSAPAGAQSSVPWLKYMIVEDDYANSNGKDHFDFNNPPPTMVHRMATATVTGEIRVSCPGYIAEQVLPTGQLDLVIYNSPDYINGTVNKTTYSGTMSLVINSGYDSCGVYYEYRWLEWGYQPDTNNPTVTSVPLAGSPYDH